MSATADENTHPDLLDGFTADGSDGSTHVFWPADPQQQQAAGRLQIELDDGCTVSGTPVTIEARVSTPGPADVQAVIRVQGLEPGWCPAPQVVTVSPDSPARLFIQLIPAAGTPPGRYLWALTAEVRDRPMLAMTAQLQVDKPKQVVPQTTPPRWRAAVRPLTVALSLLLMAVAVATALEPAWIFRGRDTAPAATPQPEPPRLRLTVPPGLSPGTPILVPVRGTVLAPKGAAPIQITVVRLNLDDLTGTRVRSGEATAAAEAPSGGTQVHGKHWSLSLPPGLYGLTFSKPGYKPESIVVATAVADTLPAPHVQLEQVGQVGQVGQVSSVPGP